MSLIRNIEIKASNSPSVDAVGFWRTSESYTIFDSKNIYNDSDIATSAENQPLYFDNQQTSGTGTSTFYNVNTASQQLTVGNLTQGTRVRQTKMHFNYQSGKSQRYQLTYTFAPNSSGITQREGAFNDNNGIFLESTIDGYFFVIRSSTSGSPVDNRIPQSQWNLDRLDGTGGRYNKSGINIDLTKVNLLIFDYLWQGVGDVRIGFQVGGGIVYAHTFEHANILENIYMSTPNLPIRSEIINDGTGPESTMTQICSNVISEGGAQDNGILRYASTSGTHISCTTENTIYAILGIKLKSAYLDASIKQINMWMQIQTASDRVEWFFKLNPVVAGTFTYVDQLHSAVQIARGSTSNTVSGGYDMTGGALESNGAPTGGAGSGSSSVENALLLGSLIDGTPDEIVLCARPIGGSTAVSVEGGMTWRELL